MMDINHMNLSSPGYILSFGLSSLFMLATVAYALWIPLYLKPTEDKLYYPERLRKYGVVYDHLWKEEIAASLRQAEAFVYRRVAYALICYYTMGIAWFQLAFLVFITIAAIILVGLATPYQDKILAKIEIFNDFSFILVLYHMMCFTDFVTLPNCPQDGYDQLPYCSDAPTGEIRTDCCEDLSHVTKYQFVGTSCIIITALNIFINLFIIAALSFSLLKAKFMTYKAKQYLKHPRSLREYQGNRNFWRAA